MPTLTIRNLPDEVVDALKDQARRHHRSMEQEVRTLLEQQVGDRASVIDRITLSWASQKRSPSADEVEAWIREGRP